MAAPETDPAGSGFSPAAPPASTIYSLLQDARALDAQAWQKLIGLYGPLVLAWCRQAGLDPADRADVTQDVFFAVHKGLPQYQHRKAGGTFRGWLLTITRNLIRDFQRRTFGQPTGQGGSAHQTNLANQPEPLTGLTDGELTPALQELYRRAIALLESEFEPQTFAAFRMLVVDGKTGDETAQALGLRRSAVYNAKSRVLRRLREELGEVQD